MNIKHHFYWQISTVVNKLRKLRFVSQFFPVNGSSNQNKKSNANYGNAVIMITFCTFCKTIANLITTYLVPFSHRSFFICQSSQVCPVEIPRYGQVRGVGPTPRSTYFNRWLQNGKRAQTSSMYLRTY